MKKINFLNALIFTIICFCCLSAKTSRAQLTPGDIAIIGVNGDTRTTPVTPFTGTIALVALVDIPSGTIIKITDYTYNGTVFGTSSSDGLLTWTVSQIVPKGTVFSISFTNSVATPVIQPSTYGTVTKNGWTNSGIRPISDVSGDSWLVYTTNPDNSFNFIYGFLNTNYTIPVNPYFDPSTGWGIIPPPPTIISTQTSLLPTQLAGTNAYNTRATYPGGTTLSAHFNSFTFPTATSGTKEEFLNNIKTPSNWASTNTPTAAKDLSPGAVGGPFSGTQPIYTVSEGPAVTSVTSTASGSKNTGKIVPITVNFSENVTVTAPSGNIPRIKLNSGNAYAYYASGSGTKNIVFNYTVADNETSADLDYSATNSLELNNGTMKSASNVDAILTLPVPGTPNSLGGTANIIIDTTIPTVTSVTAVTANGLYGIGQTIDIKVNFSEAVSVTNIPRLSLNSPGFANYLSGAESSSLTFRYIVAAGQNSADLDYANTLSFNLAGGSITDAAGNDATLTLPAPGAAGSLGANAAIIIDTTNPTVTSVSGTNGTYKIASVVPISLTFSEPITVTGTPLLALNVGSPAGNASYASGSGTNTLTFNYTIAEGQSASDLDYTGTTALSLNGGTLKDAAGNNATLTLASPGAAGSLAANSNIVINGTPPTVSSINRTTAATTNASSVNFTVTFSEAISGIDVTDFILISTGIVSPTITSLTGSGTTYTVTVNTGTGSGTLRLDLNAAGTGIVGTSSGNAIQTGYTAGQIYTIDKTAATYQLVSISSNNANTSYAKTGQVITLVFRLNEEVGTPVVTVFGNTVTPRKYASPLYQWDASYTLTGTEAEGSALFTINVTDLVGNISNTRTTTTPPATQVTYDKTPPTIPASLTFTSNLNGLPAYAKVGSIVTLTFTSNENLGSDPLVTIAGTSVTVAKVGSDYTATYTVPTPAADGMIPFTIDFQDLAGNAGVQVTNVSTGKNVTVDGLAPTLTSVTMVSNQTNPKLARSGNTVTTSFTANEPITGTIVRIGGTLTSGSLSNNNTTWAASTLVNAATAEGPLSLSIDFQDLAGNIGTTVTSTTDALPVVVDNTPPVTMAGPVVTAGDQQNVLTWTASPTANSYKIYGGTTFPIPSTLFQTLSGSNLTYIHTGLTNGSTYYYAITALDEAGNESVKSVTTSGKPNVSQTITFTAPGPRVYGSSFDLTASSTSLLPVTFSSSNSAIASVSGNTVTIVGVGAVNITASQAGNANFGAAAPVTYPLQITPLPVTVTATASSKIFGNPEPQSFGFSINPALIGTDTRTGALARVAGEDAGSYEIGIGTFALDPLKYTLNYTPANFSISQETVTINPVVNTKVFNQNDPTLSFIIDVPGVPVTGALTRTAGEDVGSYAYSISGMTVGSNYQLALNPTPKFSITPLTINVTASATTKAYGDADPVLAFTPTPALKSGDVFTGALARAAGESVGTYALNQGDLALSSNYILNFITPVNTFSITKKTITVIPVAVAKVYGEPIVPATYTYSPALKIGDSFTGNLTVPTAGPAGDHDFNIGTLALSGNYTLVFTPAAIKYSISKKPLTITPGANQGRVFGAAALPVTYSHSALASGDVLTGELAIAGGINAGDHAITLGTLSMADGKIINYEVSLAPENYNISQKAIVLTAASPSKTYGDADPTLTYTSSTAPIAPDAFTGTLGRAPGTNVGSYAINLGSVALNNNYTLTLAPGAALEIVKKDIAVLAESKSKVYGGTDPELTYTSSPTLVIGDTFSGALSRAAGEDVGAYAIGKGDLALSSNYNLNYTPANLTIGLQTINVTAKAKAKIYGEADPALEYDFTPALKSGDTFSGVLSRAAGENVGSYVIGKGDLALSSNYILNYTPANLTIGLQTINVTAKAKTKIYGEADPALDYDFTPALKSGDTFTGALSRAAGENVNIYAIGKGDLALNSNYILSYTPANLTIGLQTIEVSAKAKTKVYGEADPALDYEFSPALKSGDVFSGSLSRAAGETVNTYVIGKGDLALNSNYTLNYTPANLTITLKTINVIAKAKTKVYGEADPVLDYDFTPALKSGDTFTGALSRASGENVNTYAIGKGGLALNSNYTLNYTPATLTITLKTINVTAKAKTKVYGEADPAFDYDVLPALQPGDTFTGSLSRTAGTHIGNYIIGQGNLALNANYTLAYTPANLSITAKAIVVQAVAKSKTYGNADPLLTYTVTPALVNGDALSGSLTRISGENKGTYAISKGSLASSTDYTLSFTGADFTINAAPLTITAEAKEKFTGTANPAFTAQYTGYVNGEGNEVLTSPVVFNTPATINSPIGTYDIIPSGAAAANYSITFVKGVLTVKAGSPTNVLLAAATLYENQVSGTPAGKLSSTSDDPLATFTYSLVSGTGDTDNAAFRIAGDQLLTAASLDYETKKVYSVKVRSTTQNGFSLDKTFSINLSDVNEIPTLDAIASKTICYTTNTQTIDLTGISAGPESGQNTTITASGSNAALLQSLTVAAGSGGKAILSYRVKSGASGTSTITVTVKDDGGTNNGGVDTYSRTFVLTVNPLPIIAINANIGSNNTSNSTDVSKGETLVLTASGGSSYVWAVHNSIISGQTNASLTVRPRETTTYTVTVTNANGCSEQNSFTVNVLDDLVKIKATNILTPNGDGYNDKWVIDNIDFYPNNEVKIFDKSGRMVYSKRSYDNSWDGMLNGMPLSEGTYYYVIDFGKDRQKFKGFITIVREN